MSNALQSATLEATSSSLRGGGGALSGWASPWECQAAQRRQVGPWAGTGGELGHCQGGHFDHVAVQMITPSIFSSVSLSSSSSAIELNIGTPLYRA